jgi:hypothetical protein
MAKMGHVGKMRESGKNQTGGQVDVSKPEGGPSKAPTADPGQVNVETLAGPGDRSFGATHATEGGHKGVGIK